MNTLIPTDELARHLEDESWAIVDCRYDLAKHDAGGQHYREAHIPGAVYAHLGRDLAAVPAGIGGRHPLPDPAALAATYGRWGIDDHVQVAAYDADTGMFAARLWWVLRYMGHARVAVLDGGFAKWIREGRPTRGGEETRAAREFRGAPNDGMRASLQEVEELVRSNARDRRLVDARAPERYRGDVETIDKVAGHIPGAANRFFKDNLAPDGTFKSPEALRQQWQAVLGDRPADRVISYCGSGVTACHNLLALEHAGLRGARLYVGSWSEWTSNPDRPIEKGEDG